MKTFIPILVVVSILAMGLLIDSFVSENGGFLKSQLQGVTTTLMWDELGLLDVESGEAPNKLKKFDGESVRIPGFAVPLGDNYQTVQEFLLVPDPMSCIHIPPPPPNQIVHVRLQKEMSVQQLYGPVWVQGVLNIQIMQSQYGSAGYVLRGESITPYQ